MQLRELITELEDFAPLGCKESWDNPGLLLGRGEKEIKRVLVALDATPAVAAQAMEEGVDLILTHHPVIFRPISAVNDQSAPGRRYLTLLEQGIAVYSMHTNFDSCPGGMGDLVCERLGVKKCGPMERNPYQEPNSYQRERGEAEETGYGLGFVAELPEEMSCRSFSEMVKARFGLPYVIMYDAGRPIKRIACCPGSGRGEFSTVMKNQVDAFLTGDMGHHEGLDYMEEGVSLIDAGHYGLEHVFVAYMAAWLRDRFSGLSVTEAELSFPGKAV